jgi:2,3-dihydroxybenzoate-AMP ligase
MLYGCTTWPDEFAAEYRHKGYWSGETVGALVSRWAAAYGDRLAVVDSSSRRSYRELHDAARRTAAGLRSLGVGAGDRVVVQLPNTVEFFEVLFGVITLGAIPVVVLPAYRRVEVSYFCQLTEAVAYVIPDRHAGFDFRGLAADVLTSAPTVRHVIVAGDPGPYLSLEKARSEELGEWPDGDASDVALLHLSGGTTGTPKLIPRTHDDYLYGARASAELCGFDADTVYLCSLPVAHQFSLSAPGAFGTFLGGGRVALAAQPAPDTALAMLQRERATVAAVVPPVAAIWLGAAHEYDLSSLRLLQVGGAKLAPELARRVAIELGARPQQVFGMTEGLLNFTRLDDPDEVVFSTQGRPLSPDDEIRVVDDDDNDVPPGEPGNLLARGPNTVRGYYRADDHNKIAFTADGFYRTGDIVRQTATGHLVVVGRAKDQINRGGEKIAAEEVESHLLAHPDVAEAAVVAMPDSFLGERICAYVVTRSTNSDPAPLAAFMRSRGLAAHKAPDRYEFVDALPRTAVGKLSKRALRDDIAAKLADEEESAR